MYSLQGARLIPRIFLTLWLAVPASRAAGFLVTNTGNSGAGSLRQAILDSNNAPGTNAIQFQITGTAPFNISPASTLPSISVPVILDATTQPGFSGEPIVHLNGSSAGSGVSGLMIVCGNCTIRGLTIDNFSKSGIWLEGAGTNIIEGNYIGVGVAGNLSSGNKEGGITINRSRDNVIGGTTTAARNVIGGGNNTGVYVIDPASTGNRIIGNFIGTDSTGLLDVGNLNDGILIYNAPQNVVGGVTVAERNVISGNDQSGVYILGTNAVGNQVFGNFIGTTATGSGALKNGENGVTINGGISNEVGSVDGGKNVISGNALRGVLIIGAGAKGNSVQGNFIGTDLSGTAKLPNQYSGVGISDCSSNIVGGTETGARNVISGNGQSGVYIDSTNATATGNIVLGNFIGTDASGTHVLGNAWNGVNISGAPGNIVGGEISGAGNLISGNAQRGIFIGGSGAIANHVLGNFIGTDATGHLSLTNGFSGVWIESPGNFIGAANPAGRNLISGNAQLGIYILGASASNNIVQGNFIGTDITGRFAIQNTIAGVGITNAASNLIGGSSPGAGNLISGNAGNGIYIEGVNARLNRIQGNFVGTDFSGNFAIPNRGINNTAAIHLFSAPSNTIGGTVPGSGNLVSGNGYVAISLGLTGCNGNIVQGNMIGTKIDKISPLGNTLHGIEIHDTSSNNIVGGIVAGAGNIVAYAQSSQYTGVRVRDGCQRNSIRGNSIFGNGALGIDLGTAGTNLNGSGNANTGANAGQNFPVVVSAAGQYLTLVQGTLTAAANKTFALDFYANSAADSSGYGEGQIWLGTTNVSTSGSGIASWIFRLTNAVPAEKIISVVATDPNGNSSEFSLNATVANATFLDSDGDGMPDEFEIAVGLNPFSNIDAALDSDGDGASNLSEFLAGTNPNDSASILRLAQLEKSASGTLLQFSTALEHRYALEFSTNLSQWYALANATNIPGDKSTVQIVDVATNSANRFYRVHVLP